MATEQGEMEQVKTSVEICEECKQQPSKYKCPGCSLRSCSLPCVRAHKERTSCSGKRDRTSFIPIFEFDDNRLLSDYYLLEEMSMQTDSAKRFRSPFERMKRDLGPRWITLRNQAKRRNIDLVYMSEGMTKRTENTSKFNKKHKCIHWRIEWKFYPTDITLVSPSADEKESPTSLLAKRLSTDDAFNEFTLTQARKFCRSATEVTRFLMPKDKGKGYVLLDSVQPLCLQLSGMRIIEYPTILVVVSSDMDLTITEDRSTMRILSFVNVKPEGIPYKEEEIEEGEIVD